MPPSTKTRVTFVTLVCDLYEVRGTHGGPVVGRTVRFQPPDRRATKSHRRERHTQELRDLRRKLLCVV